MTLSEVLYKAADEIEAKGWWRSKRPTEGLGEYKDKFPDNLGRCAGLAIGDVAYLNFVKEFAVQCLGSESFDAVYAWNDAHDSGEEVINKLRAFAKELVTNS